MEAITRARRHRAGQLRIMRTPLKSQAERGGPLQMIDSLAGDASKQKQKAKRYGGLKLPSWFHGAERHPCEQSRY
jgi:hypothetical protein